MKHSKMARVLSMLLAVMMIVGMLPTMALAAEEFEFALPVAELTEEPAATDAPEVTEAPEITEAPEATEAPETTEAPAATEVPEATEGPEATETPEVTEDPEILEEEILEEEISSENKETPIYVSKDEFDTSVSDGYYNVISLEEYALAPGAVETELVVNNTDGNDRKVVHVFEVDTKNEELEVFPGYYGIDKLNPDDLAGDSAIWQAKELTKTVAYYEAMGYNVVGAMNTALAYDSNAPYGYMVWDGVVLGTPEVHAGAQTYLAIDYDGNCELRSMSTPLDGSEKTAISANFGWLVKDGVLQSKTVERTSSDASRSMIGIKADGTLVFCQVDGRNGAVSSGLSNYEMGEMMLSLGCVNAVNCDGGGSSTFVSKRAGETANTMRSVPSDGSERPTINSVILVSTAGATGDFAKVLFDTEYDYIAPGASMAFSVTGVDTKEFAMEIPAEVTYQVAEEGMGTIENGVFTAGTTTGAATIQAIYNDAVVGEKVLEVIHPETFGFTAESTVLPYGKSAELEVVATYGEDSWAVCLDGAYTLALSDSNNATLDGNTLTAPTDESIAGVDVTATYKPDTTVTDTINVTYGKGSEIIYDFEDGETAGFMGFVDAKQWSIDNSVNNTLVGSAPLDGQFNEQISSKTFVATEANGGHVHSGDYALAWSLDNTDADFASWSYNVLFNVGETIVLRDVANGMNATTLGMWLYIPEGAPGLAFQSQFYTKNADGTYSCKQDHFMFTTVSGVRKNLNSCTEADIPESRWVYASIDISKYDYLCTPVATDESNTRAPSFIRTYVKPTEPAVLTFYIDDITLDYSSAVEDRVLPTISDVCYATADTAVALENGAVINGTEIAFSAKAADNDAVAASRILVDGVVCSNSLSYNAALLPGVHTVTFEAEDRIGNLARVTRTFTVSGDALIWMEGHNDSGKPAEYDSVYYVDIVTSDISKIDGFKTTLRLQTANTWEPEGMTVAAGYEASYSLNEVEGLLTLEVSKISGVSPAVLSGNSTLLSIPVRVWSWDGVNNVTGATIAPGTHYATGNCPIVSINCEVVYGSAKINGDEAPFGGTISVATNLNDIVNPWHYHDSELTTLEQEASCVVDGYAGRTYCVTCSSVIDWGTTVPATGHTYEVTEVEGGYQLICDCGETVTGNGLVTVNGGEIYCLIADKIVTGWQAVGNDWCYAAASTKEVQTGEFTVNNMTYTADEDGIVIKGAWVTDENGTKYSYGPEFYKREWAEIDGATYYFDEDTYMYTGIQWLPVNRNNMKEGIIWHEFTEDGKYVGKVTGFVTYNDLKYYVVDGTFNYGGLMLVDGDYYYARSSGKLAVDCQYWITKNNGLLPVANYTFDAEGKMVNPPVENPDEGEGETGGDSGDSGETGGDTQEPEVKNGIVDENGTLYYYVDSVKTYGGLLLIDGDYYYARSSGKLAVNCQYWITKTNDLLPAANYTFDAEGKMVNPPVENPDEGEGETGGDSGETGGDSGDSGETGGDTQEPEVKNGIVDENGTLYYYVDGVKTYGGLLLIDGDYYYARSSGKLAVNCKYWITKNNDLLPAASYTFDAEGKMVNPPVENPDEGEGETGGDSGDSGEAGGDTQEPEVKNGIVDENGTLYYYVDGVKTYGGLLLIDGDYYYARSSGKLAVNCKYWITKNNDLLPVANYTFDAEGKMVDPPVV